MRSQSTFEPDYIRNLQGMQLVAFNIEEVEKENEDGSTYTIYEYEELKLPEWFDEERIENAVAARKRELQVKTITVRQVREQLIRDGLMSTVEAVLAAIEDPAEKAIASNYWEYSLDFDIAHPLLVQLATAIGLDSEELAELFNKAGKL